MLEALINITHYNNNKCQDIRVSCNTIYYVHSYRPT